MSWLACPWCLGKLELRTECAPDGWIHYRLVCPELLCGFLTQRCYSYQRDTWAYRVDFTGWSNLGEAS